MATAAPVKIKPSVLSRPQLHTSLMTITMGTSDFCSVLTALVLAFRFWSIFNPTIPSFQPVTFLMPVLTVATFYFFGLYPGLGLNAVTQMRRACHALTLVFLLFTAAMFMAKDRWADSRGALLVAWILSLAFTPVGRLITTKILRAQAEWGIPVMIIGAGPAAQLLIASLQEHRVLGYRPVACVSHEAMIETECFGVPIMGSLHDASIVARTMKIQHAIVAIPSMPPEQLVWHMRGWSTIFPKIFVVPNLLGIASLWTEPRDFGGLLALEIQHKLLDTWNQQLKRVVDIIGSSLILTITSPLIVIAALLIKWKSPGPAFYTQDREGKNGKPIRVLKLRSMYPGADKTLQAYLNKNPAASQEWKRFQKLKDDPRIIPGIGHCIRRASIDELPQLLNVLKGEMSLVGPRPFPDYHNTQFDPEFRDFRLQVTPGLTGLWQVTARSTGDLKVQEVADSYYIRNWSLWLDIYILIRTVRAVLQPSGSY